MKILNGKAAAVAAGIRRRATTYGYTGAEREGADECASYLPAFDMTWPHDSSLQKSQPRP